MMKTNGSSIVALAVTLVSLTAATPRQDINPALLYFEAFNKLPALDDDETKLLGTESATIGPEEHELAGRFDTAFKILRRARLQKAPCDWGTDLADGPHAFTPNFIKIRHTVYAAVLRARVALADGKQDQMRDELLAASVLGRHVAVDAVLVGVMIQYAVEGKILDFMDAHFDELKPAIRAEIVSGLKGLPHRFTVAEGIVVEQDVFHGWFLNQLTAFRAANRDDAKAVEQFRALLAGVCSADSKDADQIIRDAGGTSEGIIKYFKASEPAYARCLALAKTGPENLKQATKDLVASIEGTTNVLVRIAIPNVGKARTKELEFQTRLARLPDVAP
jgi:hypothetical protein